MKKKVVTFGEIMLRLSPPGFLRFSQTNSFDIEYGGSESNVAVSLAQFGIQVDFVTRLPENDIGACALLELRKRGVGTDHILRGGERLGIYFLENGAVARGSKVEYDRSGSAMATMETGMIDWKEVFKDAAWFHWSGITPAISASAAAACQEAILVARGMGLTISADMNIRNNLWQYGKTPAEVMPALLQECDIIFCSKGDAKHHLGAPLAETAPHASKAMAYAGICEQLRGNFPRIKKFVTSRRGSMSASHNSWSGFLYNGTDIFEAKEYQITHIVDRVGGGDSFVAGLIYGLLTYEDDQKALDFAVAASCLKHTIPGDVNLATVGEVESLMAGNSSGRVRR